jgi:lipopolysaccharide/colanic/teichoic acid biosynthesis glycosyltransferase
MRFYRKAADGEESNGAGGGIDIHSIAAFRQVIERERDRADRYSGFFSLAEFSTAGSKAPHRAAQALADCIAHRARLTDQFGWMGDTSIGVLLPETPSQGAALLARQILERIGDRIPAPACRIYTYPSGEPPQGDVAAAVRFGGKQDLGRMLAVTPPVWKRVVDVTLALLALMVLAPLLAVTAAGIKLASPRGPVLFRQPRIGRAAEPFLCLKFRTMHPNVESEPHQAHLKALIRSDTAMAKLDDDADPRILPFGRFLRLSGLDEIPQLWNVVRGEMSLVGPRPCIPYEYAEYQAWQKRRAGALPGLTGLWQVSGKNRTTFNEMVRYDISYSRSQSFCQDVGIMFRTLPAILRQMREGRRPAGVHAAATVSAHAVRGGA